MDPLRQFAADAVHPGDVLDPGPGQAAHAPERLQQLLPPLGADPADLLQDRGGAGLGPALAVAGDGEAMGLVADLLDQVHGRRVGRQYNGRPLPQQPKLLGTRAPVRPLRDAHQASRPLQPQLLERLAPPRRAGRARRR